MEWMMVGDSHPTTDDGCTRSFQAWSAVILALTVLLGAMGCGPDPAEFEVNLTSETLDSPPRSLRLKATATLDGTEISNVDDDHIDKVEYRWESLSIEESTLDDKEGQRTIVVENIQDSSGIVNVEVRVNRSGITGPAQRDLEGGDSIEFNFDESNQ